MGERRKVVPVRLNQELLAAIDALVESGAYASRSEAIRALLEAGLEKLELESKLLEAVRKLFEIEKKSGKLPIELEGGLKQLLDERGRF